MASSFLPQALVNLCRESGRSENDLVILAEGNAAVCLGDTQWVTTSGSRLSTLGLDDVVATKPEAILAAVESGCSAEDWARVTAAERTSSEQVPSIESPMHAVAAALTGAAWTLHTHPTALLGLLTTDEWEFFAETPLFPDQIVVCGPSMCPLPYVDPGRTLAEATWRVLSEFHLTKGSWPKVLLMANHGMLAIGASAEEAFNITAMTVKAARVWTAAASMGIPRGLSTTDAARIDSRPDEQHRRRALGGG